MENNFFYGQISGIFSENEEILSKIGSSIAIIDIGIQASKDAIAYINNKEFKIEGKILQLFNTYITSLKIKSDEKVIIDYKIKSYN